MTHSLRALRPLRFAVAALLLHLGTALATPAPAEVTATIAGARLVGSGVLRYFGFEVYEARHFPMDPPDPIEAIRFRMEQQGLSRRDLEPLIGHRGRVAEVMGRKRGLSIEMIRNLHDKLGISAEVLIRPTRRNEAAC